MIDLFSPIVIDGLTLPNRVIIPPMCQYSADENGEPRDWHFVHYGQLAISGAGLLIVEATAVEKDGRITPNDLGLWDDSQVERHARMLKCTRDIADVPMAIQLGHAGRKASRQRPWEGGDSLPAERGGWDVCGPSNERYCPMSHVPQPMTVKDIERITASFAAAAIRAEQVGFDAVELHLAHGYLLHQFLSPLSNVREDAYGGSLENRMRFPLEVFAAVRKALPHAIPVGVRISATDWVQGGWSIEDSLILVQKLKTLGCSFIHVSSGGLSPNQKVRTAPGYQVSLAERVKRETGLPTIAVGLITEPEQAQTIIESGQADMIAVGRAMLFNPRWTWNAALRLGQGIHAPLQYIRSAPASVKGLFI